MNFISIVIVVVITAAILVYLWNQSKKKSQDVSREDLTTEIETTEVPEVPPPTVKKEKRIIGEIDIWVRDQKISSSRITDPETRIGRDPTRCAIVISEPIVSKLHCSIMVRGNRVFIIDNNSTNGTYIDNEKISEKELQSDQTVFLGKKGNIKLVFRRED